MSRVCRASREAAYTSLVREYHRSEKFDPRVFGPVVDLRESEIPSRTGKPLRPCARPERADMLVAHRKIRNRTIHILGVQKSSEL